MASENKRWKLLLHQTDSCLSDQEIADMVDGTAPGEELRRLSEHVDQCARCSTELAMYRDFQGATLDEVQQKDADWIVSRLRDQLPAALGAESAASPATEAPRRRGLLFFRPRMWQPTFRLGLAAAVLFLAVGTYLITRTAPEIAIPGIQTSSLEVRSARIDVIAPQGDLEKVPDEFRWRPAAGVVRYEVRLFEVDNNELWKTDVTATNVAIPSQIQAKIVPGKKLLWQVKGFDLSGRVLVASDSTEIRLRPAR